MELYLHSLLLLSWFSYGAVARDRPPRTEINFDGADRFNEFDWSLAKEIGATLEENVVLSPISVKLVLAMLYEGAKGNTSSQLEKALNIMPLVRKLTSVKFSSILQSLEEPNPDFDITIGTKLFIDEEAKPKKAFENKIEDLYNATIEKINFKNTPEAVAKINAWAKSVSKGHIQHLVSDADARESTVMLLLNAVYFKGLWEHPFPLNQTFDDDFYVKPGLTKTVRYMRAVHTLKYIESTKASMVRLPYLGGKFAMYVVLPYEKYGLQDVISTINPDSLRELIPKMMEVPVQIQLPRFHFEFASSLAPALQKLGITDMFNSNADLSEIAEGPKELVVSNVIQKAGINVNEQGSTAYAATVVDLTSKFGEYTMEFKATQPFLFFIEDETTHTVIFVGKVYDPSGIGKPEVQTVVVPPPIPAGCAAESNAAGINQGGKPANGNNASKPPAGSGSDLLPLRFGNDEYPSVSTKFDQQTFSYFDIELAKGLNGFEKNNWVVSPSSIKTVLSLLIEGAGGSSLDQLLGLLRLPKNVTLALEQCREFDKQLQTPSKSATLKSLNRILVNRDIQVVPNYKVIAAEKYGVNIEKVDFSSPSAIVKKTNNWVNEATHGLIPVLLSEDALNPGSSIVILNAIYFKGDWKIPFEPTNQICFYINANECKTTNFMKATSLYKYGYVTPLSAQILELEYDDPRYSMVILLPTEREGLDITIRNLPFNSLFPILESLPYSEVNVQIPKFTIEYSLDLVPILKDLDAGEIFTSKANLEELLVSDKKSQISGIIHKAKIIVNEKGTIAAAASAVYAETLMSRQTVNFKADHPFIFFLRDKNTGFLFEGVYADPSPSSRPSAVHFPVKNGDELTIPDRFGGQITSKPDILGGEESSLPSSSHGTPQGSNSPDRFGGQGFSGSSQGSQRPSYPGDQFGGQGFSGSSQGSQPPSYPEDQFGGGPFSSSSQGGNPSGDRFGGSVSSRPNPQPPRENGPTFLSEYSPTPTTKPSIIKNTVLNRRY